MTSKNRLGFGGDPDHDVDSVFLISNFSTVVYRQCYVILTSGSVAMPEVGRLKSASYLTLPNLT